MRSYLAKRRMSQPEKEIVKRAQSRADKFGLKFDINADDISIPQTCPVLGIPMIIGQGRQAGSPSLDRILPSTGYVRHNVRVISDRANRLKGDRSAQEMRLLATICDGQQPDEYLLVADYIDRETALLTLRQNVRRASQMVQELEKAIDMLERAFGGSNPSDVS